MKMNLNSAENREMIDAALAPDGARTILEENFPGQGDAILAEIARGVDDFVMNYTEEVDEEVIACSLEQSLEGRTPSEQLSVMLTTVAGLSSQMSKQFDIENWDDKLKELTAVSEAIADGRIDENDETVAEQLAQTKQLLVEHIKYAAAFFAAIPEENLEGIVPADVSVEGIDITQGREAVLRVAALFYTMAHQGKLEDVDPETCTPYWAGVQTCVQMETMRAVSSGMSWEKVLEVVQKVWRVAVLLLVVGAIALGWANLGRFIAKLLVEIGLLTNGFVALAIIALTVALGMRGHWEEIERGVEYIANLGIKLVAKAYHKVSDWVVNTVLPAVKPLLQKAYEFVSEFVKTYVLTPVGEVVKYLAELADAQQETAPEVAVAMAGGLGTVEIDQSDAAPQTEPEATVEESGFDPLGCMSRENDNLIDF